MSDSNPSVDDALAQARALEKAGQMSRAAQLYREVLRRQPGNKLAKKRLKALQTDKSPTKTATAMATPDQSQINAMVGLFNQARLTEALATAQELCRQFPDFQPVHNFLGVVYGRLGQDAEALDSYDQALRLQPDSAEVFNNRGNALGRLGRHEQALSSFERALQRRPDYAEAHNGRGSSLQELGRSEDAAAAYRQALALRADYAEAHNNLANALQELGRPQEALESLAAALGLNPAFAQAHNNRGRVFLSLGHYQPAAQSFSEALRLRPDYHEALGGLGSALHQLGQHRQAIECFRRASQLQPDYVPAHNGLGLALSDQGNHLGALDSFQRAIQLNPEFAEGHSNLGNVLADLGRVEEAEDCYLRALAINPEFAEAYNNLSQVKTFRNGDPQLALMADRMAMPNLEDKDRLHLGYALGKAHDDLGLVDKAFGYFSQANRLQKRAIGYDIGEDEKQFALIKSLFSENLPALTTENIEPGVRQPIFIVGMPRSGTSLVEQILASHPGVFGAGELETLGRVMPSLLREMVSSGGAPDDRSLGRLRDIYRAHLAGLKTDRAFITDKMPGNFRWIGFLLRAMPAVKIVHLERDPVATCWSMFRHHFGAGGIGYSCDLEDLAAYYKLYQDLMGFWRERFPGQFYDLDYQLLTENQEVETRKLLAYCGLEWDPACLEFHATNRAVQTLSAAQVRQPMYQGSSQAWHKYQAHLQPLVRGLGLTG